MLRVDHLFTQQAIIVHLPGPRRAMRACLLPSRASSLCKGPEAGQWEEGDWGGMAGLKADAALAGAPSCPEREGREDMAAEQAWALMGERSPRFPSFCCVLENFVVEPKMCYNCSVNMGLWGSRLRDREGAWRRCPVRCMEGL